jgi:hypothetical protein
LFLPAVPVTQRTDCDSRNQGTAWGMGPDMGVEAKGFSSAQNKAAVWGVSGVLGSPIDHKKISQLLPCYASAIATHEAGVEAAGPIYQ